MHISFNKTTLSKREILNFQNLSILKSSWLVAVFAVAFVLLAFRIRNGEFVFESVFFVVLGAVLYPAYFIIVKLFMLKQNKNIPQSTTYTYEFFDKELFVLASDGVHTEKLTVRYDSAKGYANKKKYLLLFVDKSVTLFVSKNGFIETEDLKKIENLFDLKFNKEKSKKTV